jgi:hypothetical protein
MPEVLVPQKPPSSNRTLWIVVGAAAAITLTVVIAMSVYIVSIYQDSMERRVVIDGRTLVGADDEPIQLVRNDEAEDVSWAELRKFLLTDQTDRIRYEDDTFVCADSAEMLFNNAEEAGINAGYVFIEFGPGETAHACNAFRTTDKGIVYVDDTGTINGIVNADKTVELAVGDSYCPEPVFPSPGREATWECLGTVSDFTVIW